MNTGAKVLIADGGLFSASILCSFVRDSGHSILGPVATAADGVKLLRREAPAAALLDDHLPGGIDELAGALAREGVPLGLLVGCRETLQRVRGGPYAVLAKPVTFEHLADCLARLLAETRVSDDPSLRREMHHSGVYCRAYDFAC